jgi:hypothetical protein
MRARSSRVRWSRKLRYQASPLALHLALALLRRTNPTAVYSTQAICICSLWCGDKTPPTAMPTKNIAASNTAITPPFSGGKSLRICLSKSYGGRQKPHGLAALLFARRQLWAGCSVLHPLPRCFICPAVMTLRERTRWGISRLALSSNCPIAVGTRVQVGIRADDRC